MVCRNEFLTIVVTGIPGVGKTTVLRHLASIAEREGLKVHIYNFGNFMFKEAKALGLVSHRDELRKLPLRVQLLLQEKAAKLLIEEASSRLTSDDILFIDTHAIILTPSGFWPGLPVHVVKVLCPDSIVVVESPPEDIIKRQAKDVTRDRSDLGDIELVKLMLEYAKIAAFSSATAVGATVYIVQNIEGDPSIAAREILKLVEKLKGLKS